MLINVLGQRLQQIRILLLLLIIVGLLGFIMRFAFVGNLPEWIQYRNITHAHSHLAMLGWVYGALYILIVYNYQLEADKYDKLFYWTMLLTIGMLFSFIGYGYGLISILLNALHIVLSYIFIYYIHKDIVHSDTDQSDRVDLLFLKTSLFFLFISTLSTWGLGIISAIGAKGSPLYYGTIQFYLHFQFNGWFVFCILALIFRYFHNHKIDLDTVLIRKFYWALVISCFLTYALAITWSTPNSIIFWTNSAGVIIQLVALYYFVRWIKASSESLNLFLDTVSVSLWYLALICLCIKILIQGIVVIPYLATISYTIKNFVIGFIHLLNLGFVSIFILACFYILVQPQIRYFSWGIKIFLAGFIGSEICLFLQGLFLWLQWGFIPYYYTLLMGISLLMPVGISLILIAYFKKDSRALKNSF